MLNQVQVLVCKLTGSSGDVLKVFFYQRQLQRGAEDCLEAIGGRMEASLVGLCHCSRGCGKFS